MLTTPQLAKNRITPTENKTTVKDNRYKPSAKKAEPAEAEEENPFVKNRKEKEAAEQAKAEEAEKEPEPASAEEAAEPAETEDVEAQPSDPDDSEA